jgi:hypothetical protein
MKRTLTMKAARSGWVFLLVLVILAMTGDVKGTTVSAAPGSEPAVITDWNATAAAVIFADAGKVPPEAYVWFAYTQLAVYNAVNGITGRYELFKWDLPGPRGASPEAAAAAAAHRLLLGHFPGSQQRLDTAYAASMAKIPDGAAKDDGIWYGQLAADRMYDLRENDRRGANVAFTTALASGVWRPTPTASAAFAFPWLGQMETFALDHASQFRPPPPPPLTSPTYTQEFNEVKAIGSANSTSRTPAQTETALFISGVFPAPMQAGLRDLATRKRLDISDSARLFAAVEVSVADSLAAAWDAKYLYGFWRPITAIRMADDDGNAETQGEPAWTSLIATPPYPDYTSGATAIAGAVTETLMRLYGTDRIDLNLTSPATSTTRRYATAAEFNQEAIDARVWSGIHFRTADVVSNEMAKNVASWTLDRYFRPTAR